MKLAGHLILALLPITSLAQEKTFDAKSLEKRVEIRIGGNSVVIGDDYDNWSNQALRTRVRNLEFAVKALYWKLGMLEAGIGTIPVSAPGGVNCTLELSFNTYTALGATEGEARHKVMEKCTAKESFSSNCKSEKIKCAR